MSTLDPNSSIGFLIHDASRMMRSWFDRRAQDLGLTRAQWRVVIHLAAREGANQTELAEILEVDTVTLGRHIDRLEKTGWLQRRPNPNDRRVWQLYLCDEVRPSITKMEKLAADIEAAALEGVSTEERDLVISVLSRIKANATAGEDPVEQPKQSATG